MQNCSYTSCKTTYTRVGLYAASLITKLRVQHPFESSAARQINGKIMHQMLLPLSFIYSYTQYVEFMKALLPNLEAKSAIFLPNL